MNALLLLCQDSVPSTTITDDSFTVSLGSEWNLTLTPKYLEVRIAGRTIFWAFVHIIVPKNKYQRIDVHVVGNSFQLISTQNHTNAIFLVQSSRKPLIPINCQYPIHQYAKFQSQFTRAAKLFAENNE